MALESSVTHKIVTDWYNAMGKFDIDGIFAALDDDVVFIISDEKYRKTIPYLGTWKGKNSFAEASKIRNDASQITGFALRGVVAEGNTAAAWIYSKSTALNTGKECELEIVQWLELNDQGKITKCTAIFDPVPELDAFTPDK
jgi:ketosteroid isomerase-like protein